MQSKMQLFPAHHTSPDGCDWYKAMRRLQITHSLFGRQPSHTGHARLSPHVIVTTHPVATDGSTAWSRIDSTPPGANTCQHTNHYLMAMEAANIQCASPHKDTDPQVEIRWKSMWVTAKVHCPYKPHTHATTMPFGHQPGSNAHLDRFQPQCSRTIPRCMQHKAAGTLCVPQPPKHLCHRSSHPM